MDFHSMKRKELQALCKKHSISANLTNLEMANKLSSLLQEKEKPVTRGRSCLKDSDVEINETKQSKKVKFSPQNDIIEFDDEESNPREKRIMDRAKNIRMRGKEIVDKPLRVTRSRVDNVESSKEIVDKPVRGTRSRANTTVEDGLIETVEKEIVEKPVRATRSRANSSLEDGSTADVEKEIVEKPVRGTRARANSSVEDGWIAKKGENVENVEKDIVEKTVRATRARANSSVEDGLIAKKGENVENVEKDIVEKPVRATRARANSSVEDGLIVKKGETVEKDIVEKPVRATRSRENNLVPIADPPVGRKRARRAEKDVIDSLDTPVADLPVNSAAEETKLPTKRLLRNKEVVEGIVDSDTNFPVKKERVTRRGKNVSIIDEPPSVVDVAADETDLPARRLLRKREAVDEGKKEIEGEGDLVLGKNTRRKASSKGSVKDRDEVPETETIVADVVNTQSQPEKPLRQTRRTGIKVEGSEPVDEDLGKAEKVGRGKITRSRNQLGAKADAVESETKTETEVEVEIEEPLPRGGRNGNRRKTIMPPADNEEPLQRAVRISNRRKTIMPHTVNEEPQGLQTGNRRETIIPPVEKDEPLQPAVRISNRRKTIMPRAVNEEPQSIQSVAAENADQHKSSALEDDEPPAKRKKTNGTSRATKEDSFEEVSAATSNLEETKANVIVDSAEISASNSASLRIENIGVGMDICVDESVVLTEKPNMLPEFDVGKSQEYQSDMLNGIEDNSVSHTLNTTEDIGNVVVIAEETSFAETTSVAVSFAEQKNVETDEKSLTATQSSPVVVVEEERACIDSVQTLVEFEEPDESAGQILQEQLLGGNEEVQNISEVKGEASIVAQESTGILVEAAQPEEPLVGDSSPAADRLMDMHKLDYIDGLNNSVEALVPGEVSSSKETHSTDDNLFVHEEESFVQLSKIDEVCESADRDNKVLDSSKGERSFVSDCQEEKISNAEHIPHSDTFETLADKEETSSHVAEISAGGMLILENSFFSASVAKSGQDEIEEAVLTTEYDSEIGVHMTKVSTTTDEVTSDHGFGGPNEEGSTPINSEDGDTGRYETPVNCTDECQEEVQHHLPSGTPVNSRDSHEGEETFTHEIKVTDSKELMVEKKSEHEETLQKESLAPTTDADTVEDSHESMHDYQLKMLFATPFPSKPNKEETFIHETEMADGALSTDADTVEDSHGSVHDFQLKNLFATPFGSSKPNKEETFIHETEMADGVVSTDAETVEDSHESMHDYQLKNLFATPYGGSKPNKEETEMADGAVFAEKTIKEELDSSNPEIIAASDYQEGKQSNTEHILQPEVVEGHQSQLAENETSNFGAEISDGRIEDAAMTIENESEEGSYMGQVSEATDEETDKHDYEGNICINDSVKLIHENVNEEGSTPTILEDEAGDRAQTLETHVAAPESSDSVDADIPSCLHTPLKDSDEIKQGLQPNISSGTPINSENTYEEESSTQEVKMTDKAVNESFNQEDSEEMVAANNGANDETVPTEILLPNTDVETVEENSIDSDQDCELNHLFATPLSSVNQNKGEMISTCETEMADLAVSVNKTNSKVGGLRSIEDEAQEMVENEHERSLHKGNGLSTAGEEMTDKDSPETCHEGELKEFFATPFTSTKLHRDYELEIHEQMADVASASAKSIVKVVAGEFSQCETAEMPSGEKTSYGECHDNWQGDELKTMFATPSASGKSISKGCDGELSRCDTAEMQSEKDTSVRECHENWHGDELKTMFATPSTSTISRKRGETDMHENLADVAPASGESIGVVGQGDFHQCDTAEMRGGDVTSDRECHENWQGDLLKTMFATPFNSIKSRREVEMTDIAMSADKDDQKVVDESVDPSDHEEMEVVKTGEFHTENLLLSTIDVDRADEGSNNSDQECQLNLQLATQVAGEIPAKEEGTSIHETENADESGEIMGEKQNENERSFQEWNQLSTAGEETIDRDSPERWDEDELKNLFATPFDSSKLHRVEESNSHQEMTDLALTREKIITTADNSHVSTSSTLFETICEEFEVFEENMAATVNKSVTKSMTGTGNSRQENLSSPSLALHGMGFDHGVESAKSTKSPKASSGGDLFDEGGSCDMLSGQVLEDEVGSKEVLLEFRHEDAIRNNEMEVGESSVNKVEGGPAESSADKVEGGTQPHFDKFKECFNEVKVAEEAILCTGTPLPPTESEDYEVFEERISAALNQSTSKSKECTDLVKEEKTKINLSLGNLSETWTSIQEVEGCDELSGGVVSGKKSSSDVMETDFVSKVDNEDVLIEVNDEAMLEKNESELGGTNANNFEVAPMEDGKFTEISVKVEGTSQESDALMYDDFFDFDVEEQEKTDAEGQEKTKIAEGEVTYRELGQVNENITFNLAEEQHSIDEDGEISKERFENDSNEYMASEYNENVVIEVESCIILPMQDEVLELEEVANVSCGLTYAGSEEPLSKDEDFKPLAEEKCEEMRETMSFSSPARADFAIDEGTAVENAEMEQKLGGSVIKGNPKAEVNTPFPKRFYSTTMKKKNVKAGLIEGTPNKLLTAVDMKENDQSMKRGHNGTLTAAKSVTKRRALEKL